MYPASRGRFAAVLLSGALAVVAAGFGSAGASAAVGQRAEHLAGHRTAHQARGHRHRLSHGLSHGHGHSRSVHKVPTSIPHHCSKPANHRLDSWLAQVPTNSVVKFRHGTCYGLDRTLSIAHRTNVVIDGNGAKFRALTNSTKMTSAWTFTDTHRLTARDLHVVGTDKSARRPNAPYQTGLEWQHGFSVEGSSHLLLSHISVVDVWGDGVHVSYDRETASHHGVFKTRSVPSHHVTVSQARIDGTGRHGVALTDVKGFVLKDSAVSHNRWENVDVEPAVKSETARHIMIRDNKFGSNRLGMFANYGVGDGHHQGHMSIIGNVQTALPTTCRPAISISTPTVPAEKRRSHYVIKRNVMLSYANVIQVSSIDHLVVSKNTFATTGSRSECSNHSGLQLDRSAHAKITGNTFGANIDRVAQQIDCKLIQIAGNVLGG